LPPALAGGYVIIFKKALAKIIIWLKPLLLAFILSPAKAGGNSINHLNFVSLWGYYFIS
jgi:hypothetical protein